MLLRNCTSCHVLTSLCSSFYMPLSFAVPPQTHPYIRLLVKVIAGAIAVTLAFQSQLYARWLQFLGAAVAGTAVAAYGVSKNSLDPSGLAPPPCKLAHEVVAALLHQHTVSCLHVRLNMLWLAIKGGQDVGAGLEIRQLRDKTEHCTAGDSWTTCNRLLTVLTHYSHV